LRKGKQIERNPLTVRRPPFTFVVKEVSWEYHTQCTVIKACCVSTSNISLGLDVYIIHLVAVLGLLISV